MCTTENYKVIIIRAQVPSKCLKIPVLVRWGAGGHFGLQSNILERERSMEGHREGGRKGKR